MNTVFEALIPIFAVIALGWSLRRFRVIAESFWEPAERITFYVLFPALLVVSVGRADFGGVGVAGMLAATAAGIAAVAGATLPLAQRLRLDGPAMTSLLQASIRPNVYVGIAAAANMFGTKGLALFSLCVALAVPLVNTLSVVVLVRWGAGAAGTRRARNLILSVARNPLILACLLGIALNICDVGLAVPLAATLEILGHAALTVGLLAVGAGLDPDAARRSGRTVMCAVGLKLIVLPVVTLVLATAFGLEGATRAVVVLYATVPISASAYVMARQMGGDAPLLAGAITCSTLAAFVTMPMILALI